MIFPYCDAKKKYGILASTFSRAIDQLIEFGLIDINHLGGGMAKDMTTYYISDRWRDYKTPAFKEKTRQKILVGWDSLRKTEKRKQARKERLVQKQATKTLLQQATKTLLRK